MQVGMTAIFKNANHARWSITLPTNTMCPDSYAGMPSDEAERSRCLFAREVMPVLQKLDAGRPAAERP